MKNILLIFIFELCFLNHAFSQSRELSFLQNTPLKEHFDTNNYAGGIQNWCFDQSQNGVLYVANSKGLLAFDGQNWTKHPVSLNTMLRVVKISSEGKIFIGGQGQFGFFSGNSTELKFTSLIPHIPKDKQSISETWKILEYNKKMYFNTESEIYVYDNNSIKALKLPGYLRYIFKVNNRFIIQIYNQGLFELIKDQFVPIRGTRINQDIISILPFKDNFLCVTKEGSFYLLDSNGLTLKNITQNLGTVNSAIKLKSGDFAIGTQSNGVFIFSSNYTLKNHLTKNNGLSDKTVKALYEDNFQNLWVALNNGIDYLKLSLPFSLINEELGIEGTGYAATYFNNGLYLGTNTGAYLGSPYQSNSQISSFKLIPNSEGQVYNFTEINNSLFLNHNRGAFQFYNPNTLIQFEQIGNWDLMQTNIPNIIAGTGYRGITFYKKNNNLWSALPNKPSLDESLRMVKFENDSTIWATHNLKGVFKIEIDKNFNQKNEIQHFDQEDGFPSNINNEVFSIDDKLIFTSEKGIYQFNNETNKFTPNNYLNSYLGLENVSAISSSNNNSIFYIQNQKFGELTNKGIGNFESKKSIFQHINKLISDNLPNISVLNNKNILIGAKEGFVLYNPDKKIVVNEDFKVLLRSIEIESLTDSVKTHSPSLREKIEITQSQSIKFQYASPYFDGFEDLKYSCRLLPLNNEWSNWSDLGEKEYTHLPSGDYTIEIKALNIYDIESEITTFSFEVLTPWFLTKWAKLSYLLLILITLTLLPFLQRIRFKKEKSILYEDKAEALKIKDEEINKLENDNLKTELDFKNDQLTTITMQLVKNNDFILNIQHEIETSLNEKNPNKGMNKIIKNIDKELSKDDSWDKFAYHFDQVHGNYLKKLAENNIKLSPREIKLAAFLRMNMSSKEISAMLNITTRGVELARYRLRKKLKLERDQNLVEYLIALDND